MLFGKYFFLTLSLSLSVATASSTKKAVACYLDCGENGKCMLRDEAEGGGMRCLCNSGWTGMLCDIVYDTCSNSHTCLHGGRCIPGLVDDFGNSQHFCDCTDAIGSDGSVFVGKYCEHQAVNYCKASGDEAFCVNSGYCNPDYPNSGTPCICSEEHTGPHCQYAKGSVPECDLACENGGFCVLGASTSSSSGREDTFFDDVSQDLKSCKCPDGFGGPLCDKKKEPCGDQGFCYHGSTCVEQFQTDGSIHFQCDCQSANSGTTSYAGRWCQYEATSFCLKVHDAGGGLFCVNNGVCNGSDGCLCPDGWTGGSCEIEAVVDAGQQPMMGNLAAYPESGGTTNVQEGEIAFQSSSENVQEGEQMIGEEPSVHDGQLVVGADGATVHDGTVVFGDSEADADDDVAVDDNSINSNVYDGQLVIGGDGATVHDGTIAIGDDGLDGDDDQVVDDNNNNNVYEGQVVIGGDGATVHDGMQVIGDDEVINDGVANDDGVADDDGIYDDDGADDDVVIDKDTVMCTSGDYSSPSLSSDKPHAYCLHGGACREVIHSSQQEHPGCYCPYPWTGEHCENHLEISAGKLVFSSADDDDDDDGIDGSYPFSLEACGDDGLYCSHGAMCLQHEGRFLCDCTTTSSSIPMAFSGSSCEHKASDICVAGEVSSKPQAFCLNDGTCKAEVEEGDS
jgi:hypothetical protein